MRLRGNGSREEHRTHLADPLFVVSSYRGSISGSCESIAPDFGPDVSFRLRLPGSERILPGSGYLVDLESRFDTYHDSPARQRPGPYALVIYEDLRARVNRPKKKKDRVHVAISTIARVFPAIRPPQCNPLLGCSAKTSVLGSRESTKPAARHEFRNSVPKYFRDSVSNTFMHLTSTVSLEFPI